jgi:hypothetical protein
LSQELFLFLEFDPLLVGPGSFTENGLCLLFNILQTVSNSNGRDVDYCDYFYFFGTRLVFLLELLNLIF